MKQEELLKLNSAVCDKTKEIADKEDAVREAVVNKLYNMNTCEHTGWAPTFRLKGKYSYDNVFFKSLAQDFCSGTWCIKVVRGALELTIHVRFIDAQMLTAKSSGNENNPD